jgi:signal transduction histidine kinase
MQDLIRSIWHEPRPPHPPPRSWRDWALVAVLVPATVIEGLGWPDEPAPVLSMIFTALLVPTLLWRRSAPLLMVAIAFIGSGLAPLAMDGAQPELRTAVFILLLPYSLYRWGSGREAVLGSAIILGKVGFATALGHGTLGDAAGGLVVLPAVCAAGAAMRYRARARMRELDQAKLLERERLARDLHDTVAHHVSAMAIRAQAGLATSASRPEAATDALQVIEAEAVRALAEMRTMVRALRKDEPAALAPNPSIPDIEQLADQSSGGPVVDVEIAGDVEGVPPTIGAAIYRLVQESVTNARRHARHATRITVRVAADETAVRLRVSDDGDPSHARPNGSSGYGLVGMIERADLLGGSCQAGPNPDRGWTVTAVLPLTAS